MSERFKQETNGKMGGMRPCSEASQDAVQSYDKGFQERIANLSTPTSPSSYYSNTPTEVGGGGAGFPAEAFFYLALLGEALLLAYGIAHFLWGYVLDTSLVSGGIGSILSVFDDRLNVKKFLEGLGLVALVFIAYLILNSTRMMLSLTLWPRILLWAAPAGWMGALFEQLVAETLTGMFGFQLHAGWRIAGAVTAIFCAGCGIYVGQTEVASEQAAKTYRHATAS